MKYALIVIGIAMLSQIVTAACYSNSYTYGQAKATVEICGTDLHVPTTMGDTVVISCSQGADLFVGTDGQDCGNHGCGGTYKESPYTYIFTTKPADLCFACWDKQRVKSNIYETDYTAWVSQGTCYQNLYYAQEGAGNVANQPLHEKTLLDKILEWLKDLFGLGSLAPSPSNYKTISKGGRL